MKSTSVMLVNVGVQFGFGHGLPPVVGLADADLTVNLPFLLDVAVKSSVAVKLVDWGSTELFGFTPLLEQRTSAV